MEINELEQIKENIDNLKTSAVQSHEYKQLFDLFTQLLTITDQLVEEVEASTKKE